MKGKTLDKSQASLYDPLKKKTFESALTFFFEKELPRFGSLAIKCLVENIKLLVDEYYPSNKNIKMGQLMWTAVDENETSGYGKAIEKCKLKPVILDVINNDDINKLLSNVKKREIKKGIAVRLFNQAKKQGGVLTNVDVASIIKLTPQTISKYICEYEKINKTLVPRRGTIHDMGRSLTHKREICYKIIVDGKNVEETARETNHSPEAITRYIKDYKRVYTCLAKGLSIDEISFIVHVSKNLVYEYKNLIEENNLINIKEDDNFFEPLY